jgi:hypothetical protein
MNFQAAVKGIAPAGGIRPASHITASSVSATKAEPAAHYLVPAILSIALGGPTGAIARVIEGRSTLRVGCSDLSPSSTLTGQRSYTDERERPSKRFGLMQGSRRATSRSGGIHGLSARMELKSMSHWSRNLGNPCAEKVRPHRPRQNNVSEPALVAGVGDHRQGTLTITGSNVRLGTEMPVALSYF